MLLKVGKLEVVENPMFMTEARRKELERKKERQLRRLREGLTLMSNLKTWLGTKKRGCTTTPVHARTASRYPVANSRTMKLSLHVS